MMHHDTLVWLKVWYYSSDETPLKNILHNKNHEVYLDNYFTSVPLFEHLKNASVGACGTIKTNRKFLPTHLKQDQTMKRGDFDYQGWEMVVKRNLIVRWL